MSSFEHRSIECFHRVRLVHLFSLDCLGGILLCDLKDTYFEGNEMPLL